MMNYPDSIYSPLLRSNLQRHQSTGHNHKWGDKYSARNTLIIHETITEHCVDVIISLWTLNCDGLFSIHTITYAQSFLEEEASFSSVVNLLHKVLLLYCTCERVKSSLFCFLLLIHFCCRGCLLCDQRDWDSSAWRLLPLRSFSVDTLALAVCLGLRRWFKRSHDGLSPPPTSNVSGEMYIYILS